MYILNHKTLGNDYAETIEDNCSSQTKQMIHKFQLTNNFTHAGSHPQMYFVK